MGGARISFQPETFCFTCENSIQLMNGQCLHFVKLNSLLGQNSMGITMAAQGQGQGTRVLGSKGLRILALAVAA